MRVLLTGGTGFVGSHVTVALLGAGHDVRLLARDADKVSRVLTPLGVRVEDVSRGDMTTANDVARALQGCDAVVHCAAEIGVSDGGSRLGQANLLGAQNVLGQAAAKACDPIVYTSSITAYLPTEAELLTAASPLAQPRSDYGAQKAAIEHYVRDLSESGAPVTTLILGGVYGPVSPHPESSFSALIESLAAGMFGPPGGLGILDVRDVGDLVVGVLQPGHGPRRFLASGTYVTWEQWAAELSQAVGREAPFTRVTAEDMIEMGKQFDVLHAAGEVMPPLSEEAAIIMAAGIPGDDAPTLAALGITYRPVVETFRDAVTWLAENGHLAAP